MAKVKEIKTNAMRILDRFKIPHSHHTYLCDEFINGIQIADQLSLPHELVYKTLVTVGAGKNYYVFVIPIEKEIDLKKAAREVGEKSLSMLPVREINTVTGYIRGGCTAVGMIKQYTSRISRDAETLPKIIVSGGRIGSQLELSPGDLLRASGAQYADICAE